MSKDRLIGSEGTIQLKPFVIAAWINGTGAFQTGEFIFNSGLHSPAKVDSDVLRKDEFKKFHYGISLSLAVLIRERVVKPDVIVGVISGGASFAFDAAGFTGCEAAARLGNTDTPDRREMIEGEIKSGDKVVIVEDVITTGGNTLAAKEQIEEEGGEVVMAVSVFDYGFERARENFEASNLPYASLTTLAHLIQVLEWKNEQGLVIRLNDWRRHTVPEFFARQA